MATRRVSSAPKSEARDTSNLKLIGGVFALGALVAGGAIMFGRSDTGEIDVSAAISNSNASQAQNQEGEGQAPVPTVPAAFQGRPNGGLVPQGGEQKTETQPAPVEETSPDATPTPESDENTTSEEESTESNAETNESSPEEGDIEPVTETNNGAQ